MKLQFHLKQLQRIQRQHAHPLIYHVHRHYRLSKRTLFYVKEYGPHSHVARIIIKESLGIVIFASILSSLGGLALESIKHLFLSLLPLLIILPVLNDLIGSYGAIVSSRFSMLLHEGKATHRALASPEVRALFAQIAIIAFITGILSTAAALAIAALTGFPLTLGFAFKLLALIIIDMAVLVTLLMTVAIYGGLYFYRKNEDPNNLLIPLTTAIADLGNMLVLSGLVVLFFG